jgi:hypothetical protein
MSRLEQISGRNYLSYSSLSSYLDCSERWRLERVLKAPQTDAWYFAGGSSVHGASEDLDRDGITDEGEAFAYWNTNWQANLAKIDDLSKVKAGGRATKEWPDKENRAWWEAKGPEFVANWIRWRTTKFNEGWQFLPMPDGSPAIEVPIQVVLNEGTDDHVLVKGYVDRVLVNDDGEVMVVDLKSGSRLPASSLQLGIYGLGMQRNFGITAPLGAYWMARTGVLSQPSSLLHYTHDLVGKWFGNAQKGIEENVFIPHVGPFCGSCGVAPYCAAVGGSENALHVVSTSR